MPVWKLEYAVIDEELDDVGELGLLVYDCGDDSSAHFSFDLLVQFVDLLMPFE